MFIYLYNYIDHSYNYKKKTTETRTIHIIHLTYDRSFEIDHEEKLLSKLPSVLFHSLSAIEL